ncbi:MAG: hypothetical protein KGL95_16155, partial [Patescibacteria group bacterium]|nr:hypothetical protein [Patescibacteria group bacterium]
YTHVKPTQEAITTTNVPTPTPAQPAMVQAQPEIIASSFYSAYQDCLSLGSSPDSSLTLSQFCQTNNRLTLDSYNEEVKKQVINGTGIDPVFCAKAPPQDLHRAYLNLGQTTFQGQTAIIPIIEKYPDKVVTILFYEEKNNLGQWKVAKIVCQ